MIDFTPLWKLLLDKKMKKEDLRTAIGVSFSTMSKMNKGEYVAMRIIDDICNYLDCDIVDVIKHVKNDKSKDENRTN